MWSCRQVLKIVRFLERRPWLLAAIHFSLFALAGMGYVVLASNQCPSQLRLWPELSDRFIVVVADVCQAAVKTSSVWGVVVIAAPFLPLVYGRWDTVRRMIFAAFLTTGVVYGCFWHLFCNIEGMAECDISVARHNLKKQAEAIRNGEPYKRVPLMKLERTLWRYGDNRYYLHKMDDGTIYLYDGKFEPLNHDHTLWQERLLLEDVKSWNDGGDQLLLTTRAGECAVLTYKTGEVKMLQEKENAK